jgi:16S rRNA (uracil1498-N3)-methyltransferase
VTAPVFVVESAQLTGDGPVVLDGPEGRHAATVRRLTVGEPVDLTDGTGLVAHGRVVAVERDRLEVTVDRRSQSQAPQPRLVVVQALPKGDRGELAVEVMTEIGVDVVVPWAAARCVTRWTGDRGHKALGRWRSTAREAAKQSRRAWFPEVAELATTPEVVSRLGGAALALVLHEAADEALADVAPPDSGDVVVVVGPEGGLTDDELAAFRAAGAAAYRLGPTVLRTSTAGPAALAVLLSRTTRWRGAT